MVDIKRLNSHLIIINSLFIYTLFLLMHDAKSISPSRNCVKLLKSENCCQKCSSGFYVTHCLCIRDQTKSHVFAFETLQCIISYMIIPLTLTTAFFLLLRISYINSIKSRAKTERLGNPIEFDDSCLHNKAAKLELYTIEKKVWLGKLELEESSGSFNPISFEADESDAFYLFNDHKSDGNEILKSIKSIDEDYNDDEATSQDSISERKDSEIYQEDEFNIVL